jgi:hypothetical protein
MMQASGLGTNRQPSMGDIASHRLKHHLKRYPVPEWVPVTFRLHQQAYPNPHPTELMLRNDVWARPGATRGEYTRLLYGDLEECHSWHIVTLELCNCTTRFQQGAWDGYSRRYVGYRCRHC